MELVTFIVALAVVIVMILSKKFNPSFCLFVGAIVAAISMTIPLFRYEESQKERILDALTETSRHIQLTIEKTNAHFTDVF